MIKMYRSVCRIWLFDKFIFLNYIYPLKRQIKKKCRIEHRTQGGSLHFQKQVCMLNNLQENPGCFLTFNFLSDFRRSRTISTSNSSIKQCYKMCLQMNKNVIVHSKCTKQKWSNKCGTKALSL